MKPVLSRGRSRELDRVAIEQLGIPGLVLMENAGRGACELLVEHFGDHPVVVVCGSGNNGGDGYVVARRLLTLGRSVRVVATTPTGALRGDAAINAAAYRALGGAIVLDESDDCSLLAGAVSGAGVVVDALFGTGLSRVVEGRLASVIRFINGLDLPVLALDIPSGIDADTGVTLGVAIRARLTATFAALKCGLMTPNGAAHCGRLHVVDIGVGIAPLLRGAADADTFETSDAAAVLRERRRPAHKGDAGRVMLVAGSVGMLGAARLAARGAHRGGAGLVAVATTAEAADALDASTLETMTTRIGTDDPVAELKVAVSRQDVVAVGPGLGTGAVARKLVEALVAEWDRTLVLDADALNLFAGRAEQLARAAGRLILTPHPAEAARLLGTGAEQVEADRYGSIKRLAMLTGATVLLKGAHTLVSDGQRVRVNTSGNAALAVGGAGDVLTGLVAALAVHSSPMDAASCAAWLHGHAAQLWSVEHQTTCGMLAHEIADRIPRAIADVSA